MSIGPPEGCRQTAIVGSATTFASRIRCKCTRIYYQVTEPGNEVLSFGWRTRASSRPGPLAECKNITWYGFLFLKFDLGCDRIYDRVSESENGVLNFHERPSGSCGLGPVAEWILEVRN